MIVEIALHFWHFLGIGTRRGVDLFVPPEPHFAEPQGTEPQPEASVMTIGFTEISSWIASVTNLNCMDLAVSPSSDSTA